MYPIIDNISIAMEEKGWTLKQSLDVDTFKSNTHPENSKASDIGEKKADIKHEDTLCECQICGKKFSKKSSLNTHLMHHNQYKKKARYQCVGCNQYFDKEKHRQEHELQCEKNIKSAQLECCFCDLPCDTPKRLRTHENKHRPIRKTKNYKNLCVCTECRKAFDAIFSLKIHIQREHRRNNGKPVTTNSSMTPKRSKVKSIQENKTVEDLEGDASEPNIQKAEVNTTNIEVENDTDSRKKPIEEKPFICSKCGSKYKYEKSRLKHEMKYHPKKETPAGSKEEPECFSIEGPSAAIPLTSQHTCNKSESITDPIPKPASGEAEITEDQYSKNDTINNSNSVNGIKAEDRCLVLDVSVRSTEICPATFTCWSDWVIDMERCTIQSCVRKENKLINNSFPVGNTQDYSTSDSYTDDQSQSNLRCNAQQQAINKRKCIGCDETFVSIKEKNEHELRCSVNYFNKNFNCMFCDYPFNTPKALRKHERKHRPIRKTKKYKNRCICIECRRTFDAVYSLKIHMQKLHLKDYVKPFVAKPFVCGICGARFKYEKSKLKHEGRYHLNQETKSSEQLMGQYKCQISANSESLKSSQNGDLEAQTTAVPVCKLESGSAENESKSETQFSIEEAYNSHCYKRHETKVIDNFNFMNNIKTEKDDLESFTTDLSGNISQRPAEFNLQLESKIIPPPDDQQGEGKVKKATRKRTLIKRSVTQKMGPYVCGKCEAKFNSRQGLWLHSYHQNKRSKRLSCIGCKRSCKGERETKNHELKCDLNYNDYEFNCRFCDLPFSTPKLLRNHELKHRPQRKTKKHKCKCVECRKHFVTIHSLKDHIKTNHKTKHKKLGNESVYDSELESNTQQDWTTGTLPKTKTLKEMMSCYVVLHDITARLGEDKALGQQNFNECNDLIQSDKILKIECEQGDAEMVSNNNVVDVEYPIGEMDSNSNTGIISHEECVADCLNIENGCAPAEVSFSGSGKGRINRNCTPNPMIEEGQTQTQTKQVVVHEEPVRQKLHSGLFSCSKCEAQFDSYGKLRYHSYAHRQRTRKFFCIGCGEGFEQNNDKDRHELDCHVNKSSKDFNCIFCELPFHTPKSLRNHEKKHRPPKRYKRYKHMCLCAECDRAFDAVFTLKIHIRHMHKGNKEEVKVKKEREEDSYLNSEGDLKCEEIQFNNDIKVEKLH